MALSDTWLKAHLKKPHEKALEKADGAGLSARVSPTGKVTFQMRYRVAGAPARLDLGTYPLMSLKDARAQHQLMKAELEKGHDPRMVKRVELARLGDRLTNEQLYRRWHEAYCEERMQRADHYLRTFEIHVFPKLGKLPADETGTHQWMSLIEDIATRTPAIAERVLTTAKQMQKWGHRRGLLSEKPLSDITAREDLLIEKTESGRSLSEEEISLFWHSTDSSKMAHRNKLFLKLCLFFGCRNGELRQVDPLVDLDFRAMTWTIPPEKNKVRKKVKRPIVRPIIPEVVPMLEEAISLSRSKSLLFTTDSLPKAISPSAVLCMPYSVMLNAKTRFGVDMEHWSMHDLRKTARTNFSTLTSVHVAEVMLGHSLKGMQAVYDRHLYLEEQADAYKKWWDRLQALVAVPPRVS